MNKIEFKELDKEQMIIAFNQLKDDYHNVFEEKESLRSTLKEIREYIEKHKFAYENPLTRNIYNVSRCDEVLEKINKGIGE